MAEALADAYHKGLADRWQRLMRVVAAVAANEEAVDYGQQERLWSQIQEQQLERHLEMRLASLTAVPSSGISASTTVAATDTNEAGGDAADTAPRIRQPTMRMQLHTGIGVKGIKDKQLGKVRMMGRLGGVPSAATCSPLAMLMSTVFSPMKVADKQRR
jgi:hypothetical protein